MPLFSKVNPDHYPQFITMFHKHFSVYWMPLTLSFDKAKMNGLDTVYFSFVDSNLNGSKPEYMMANADYISYACDVDGMVKIQPFPRKHIVAVTSFFEEFFDYVIANKIESL